jgi:phage tail-like protein
VALQELDSAVAHTFSFEADGITIKQIMEVTGIKMEQDVVELKEQTADGKYVVKALPGRGKYRVEVTLTRGLTADQSFDKWIKDSRFGKMGDARKNAAITVYDYEGNPLKRYKMTNAWPKSLEVSSLKAGDTSVLTEKLVVTCEMLEAE